MMQHSSQLQAPGCRSRVLSRSTVQPRALFGRKAAVPVKEAPAKTTKGKAAPVKKTVSSKTTKQQAAPAPKRLAANRISSVWYNT